MLTYTHSRLAHTHAHTHHVASVTLTFTDSFDDMSSSIAVGETDQINWTTLSC